MKDMILVSVHSQIGLYMESGSDSPLVNIDFIVITKVSIVDHAS